MGKSSMSYHHREISRVGRMYIESIRSDFDIVLAGKELGKK